MSKARRVSPSWDEKKWPICKKCGKPSKGVFVDNGLCPTCDLKNEDKRKVGR